METDKYWNPRTPCEQGGRYDPRIAVRRQLNHFFGSRLKYILIRGLTDASIEALITVEGLPGEGTAEDVYKELAKLFAVVPGRFSTLYWDKVEKLDMTYTVEDKEILNITIHNITIHYDEFSKWLENNLRISELDKCANFTLLAPEFELPPFQGEDKWCTEEMDKQINHDITYKEIMEKLKSYQGVKVAHLGYSGENLNAVFTMGGGKDEEIFKKQMDIAFEVMQLPVHSIWFISESANLVRMTHLDRDRYNVLRYMNADKDVGIELKEWPIVVTKFWDTRQ